MTIRKSAKKATRGKGKTSRAKKAPEVNLREVRQKVRNAVGALAPAIAKKVAEEVSSKAQVSSMKTLFEVIGLFPESPEEKRAAGDDQALARVLLERLGLSDEPVMNEEEAEEQRQLEASARAMLLPAANPVE
jgi:hypothetical protein